MTGTYQQARITHDQLIKVLRTIRRALLMIVRCIEEEWPEVRQ